MKVTHVCPRYHPHIGGVETYVRELAVRQADRGYEVEVFTTDPGGKLPKEEEIDGVEVHRFPSFAPGEAYYFSGKLQRAIKKGSYDVLHAHSYHALPGPRALKSARARVKVFNPYFHGRGHTFFRNALHVPYRLWARGALSRADTIVTLSRHEVGLLERRFALEDKNKVIIPPGLDVNEIRETRKRHPRLAGEDRRIVLSVGRLEEYKGVGKLLEALRRLPQHRLVIVGSGPHEDALRRQAGDLKVAGRVEWRGSVSRDELLKEYRSASVFAALSPYESYGITVAEALALGTPCVVVRAGALQEFEDGKRCRGVGWPVDAAELADAISGPFPQERKRPEAWSWDDVVEKVEEAYG